MCTDCMYFHHDVSGKMEQVRFYVPRVPPHSKTPRRMTLRKEGELAASDSEVNVIRPSSESCAVRNDLSMPLPPKSSLGSFSVSI